MSTANSFEVRLTTANVSASANAYTKIPFNAEIRDPSTAFDNTTNFDFTVPGGAGGIYQVDLLAGLKSVADGVAVAAAIYKNGSIYTQGYVRTGAAGDAGASISISLELAPGDTLSGYVFNGDSVARNIDTNSINSRFSAFLVG